jgi:hypothetical protein
MAMDQDHMSAEPDVYVMCSVRLVRGLKKLSVVVVVVVVLVVVASLDALDDDDEFTAFDANCLYKAFQDVPTSSVTK